MLQHLPGTTTRFTCPRCGAVHHLVLPTEHAAQLGDTILARLVHGEVPGGTPKGYWLVADRRS